MLYRIYILSLYYLNLFHIVQCISSIMSNVLVICISRLYVVKSYQEKNAWLLGKKSLCLCAYGLVFQPILWFSIFWFPFHFLVVYIFIPAIIPVMKLSLCCPVCFISVLLVQLTALPKPYKRWKKYLPILCCNGHAMVMQVIIVLFKWTSEPVKAFEGKITYIALTS